MGKRVLVAVIGVPLLLGILSFAPEWATMLLLAVLCAVGAYELMHAVVGEQGRKLVPLTVLVAILVPVELYWSQALGNPVSASGFSFDTVMTLFDARAGVSWPGTMLPLLALVFVFILFVYLILHYGKETAVPFRDLTAAIFAGLVFPLMLSCLLRLRMLGDYGVVLVWMPLAISFGSDTFALFAGMSFGKHKLAPQVSPKKTVEGAFGGLAGGVIGLSLLHGVALWLAGVSFLSWWQILLCGLLGSVVSQIGDLAFSVIKREYGVKDYGKLLPGHGGVLDRFDSVTFVSPLVWLILMLVG